MKIIDTHAHIFPDKIAERAVLSISEFYNHVPMKHAGSSEALVESGNRAGVDKYLVFSTATTVHQIESINNFIIEQISAYKQFIGLGTMYIGYENVKAELKRLKENGIHGIKLHPDFQKFDFDTGEMYSVYEELEKNNMFILTHAGDYRYGYSHPERIARVAKDFPKLNIIAAHFGGWSQWDIAVQCLNLPNVYFDTSSTLGFDGSLHAKKAFETFDNTHIFFGTDFPMWDHETEIENIKKLKLSDDVFEGVMYRNFCGFYKKYNDNNLF